MATTDNTAAEIRGYLDRHIARWGEHLAVHVDVDDLRDWLAHVEALGASAAVEDLATLLCARNPRYDWHEAVHEATRIVQAAGPRAAE